MEDFLPQLAGIIVLGIAAQWAAWRAGLPSILLLLVLGLIVGPVTGWIDPDALFGDLLHPFVSLAVALILYEGGLTLKLSDLPKIHLPVISLVSVGAVLTWMITATAAYFVIGLSMPLSVLLGAVLIVTGPTVIAPLLRHIRPTGLVGPVLRWEGIVIDPIGASLTVLVFEAVMIAQTREATAHVAIAILKTAAVGGGLGIVAAAILVIVLQRYWIADYLQSAASLMFVVATFTIANMIQHEAGLLAVTVMGFAVANQKRVDVEHIIEFKENLQVLLLSTLFIVLAARLDFADLASLAGRGTLFVVILIVVARPLSVWVSTIRGPLMGRDRLFLAAMAPRGIVAAAVASVLALRLEHAGFEEAGQLVPITFMTIIGTVAFYGIASPLIARRLGVSESDPQGVLFVGAQPWVRDIGLLLQREGFKVRLVDSNWDHVNEARMAGLPTTAGSILAEHTLDTMDLGGIGRLLAVTPNDWVNILAVQRFGRIFGRAGCYQLAAERHAPGGHKHRHKHGRLLFGEEVTNHTFELKHARGFTPKATRLSEQFEYGAFKARYEEGFIPLFVYDDQKRLRVITSESDQEPAPGETIIGLVQEQE